MLLIYLLAGTSADVWMAVYLAITTAEQIRCSHTSQDHIIHFAENHCHSLTQSCPPLFLRVSFSHSLPHTHTLAPRPLTQTLIIKLEGTQGQRFISFPKGKVENFN